MKKRTAHGLWEDERDEHDDSRGGVIRGLVFALPASVVFWVLVALLVWGVLRWRI